MCLLLTILSEIIILEDIIEGHSLFFGLFLFLGDLDFIDDAGKFCDGTAVFFNEPFFILYSEK